MGEAFPVVGEGTGPGMFCETGTGRGDTGRGTTEPARLIPRRAVPGGCPWEGHSDSFDHLEGSSSHSCGLLGTRRVPGGGLVLQVLMSSPHQHYT